MRRIRELKVQARTDHSLKRTQARKISQSLLAAASCAANLDVPIVFEMLHVPEAQKSKWSPRRIPVFARSDKQTNLCLQAWDLPNIHSDGTVFPCCVVSEAKWSLGNVLEVPFAKIWNGPLVTAMRCYLKTGARPKHELPCYGCPHNPHA